MKLSGAQIGLYNRLFSAVQKANPDADRLAMHAELGLPRSRKDWTQRHFDEWKRACLAITEPDNLDAQLHGLSGSEKRRLWVIQDLLRKLHRPESYAEATAHNMGLQPPLDSLSEADLERVIIALRKQLGREKDKPAEIPADNVPF